MNKKLLAAAIAGALTVPMSAQAIQYKLSGHVNRAIMHADDGVASDTMQVDNGASQSRVTIKGSDSLGIGGITVGVLMEWSVGSNMSSNVSIKGNNGNGNGTDSAFGIRHSALWFSGQFGKLTMGHTSGAYDGKVFADQSGTVALGGIQNGAATFGGSVAWRTSAGGTVANGTNLLDVNAVSNSFDGGRFDLIRYDAPKLGPVSAAVAIGDDQRWDAGVAIKTTFSGATLRLDGGYEDRSNNADYDQWGISGSVLLAQGTNLNIAYSERDLKRTATRASRDADTFYIKLGHRWGNNSAAIDFIQTDDLVANNDEYTSWGLGIAHNVPGPNVQFYASYRHRELNRPNVNFEDMDVFAVGSRVRF